MSEQVAKILRMEARTERSELARHIRKPVRGRIEFKERPRSEEPTRLRDRLNRWRILTLPSRPATPGKSTPPRQLMVFPGQVFVSSALKNDTATATGLFANLKHQLEAVKADAPTAQMENLAGKLAATLAQNLPTANSLPTAKKPTGDFSFPTILFARSKELFAPSEIIITGGMTGFDLSLQALNNGVKFAMRLLEDMVNSQRKTAAREAMDEPNLDQIRALNNE
jgi:hypothetical protein